MKLSSTAVAQMLEGSYYDRIVAHMRLGEEKAPLKDEDRVLFERLQWVTEQWQECKDDRQTVQRTMQHWKISQAQAYNYLADAKRLYGLFITYDTMAEMMVLKERIDTAFKLAEEHPKEYGKLYAAAMERYEKWILMMDDFKARMKPEERKQFHFLFHTDITKLPGMTEELMNEWNARFDQLEVKAKSKFKKVIDVEYIEQSAD